MPHRLPARDPAHASRFRSLHAGTNGGPAAIRSPTATASTRPQPTAPSPSCTSSNQGDGVLANHFPRTAIQAIAHAEAVREASCSN